jgi:hypothetical protein
MKLLPIYVAVAVFALLLCHHLCVHSNKHDAALPLDPHGNIIMQK